ncbi:MAG: hypothetical protein HY277_03625, partial [Ignavibacteriales bacterium]|nr:hypothetical protein [Ignavibacteriales bacterium]
MNRIFVTLFSLALFLTTFFSFIHIYHDRDQVRGESEGASGAMEALDFWTRSRAYPEKDIPSEKYVKAYQYSKQHLKNSRPTPQSSPWQFIGPTNLSGRTISVACNPQNGNTVYVGSASGGLWRSYTGGLGSDWERVMLGFPALGVSAIAIDPTDTNTMYIGTGEVYRYQGTFGGLVVRTTRGSYGIGILKTTDGGATWTKSLDWSMNEERGIQTLKINTLNPNTVWAATTEGIYKSTDAGDTWLNLFYLPMSEDILIDPTDTNRVMISYGNLAIEAGIFRTDDGGANWNPLSFPTYSGKILLEMYAAHPNVVYASAADSTTGVTGLWRSTDFGTNWTLLNSDGIAGVQGWYSHFVAVHPTDSTQVVHAGVGIYKSTNGGVSFFGSSGSYSDHHQYAHDPFNPNILYVVNDNGIYRSTDFGSSFTNVSFGLATGQFYNGFSNSTTDSLLAIVQSQDHIPGYMYQGSLLWSRSAVDECGWTGIDPTNDNIM